MDTLQIRLDFKTGCPQEIPLLCSGANLHFFGMGPIDFSERQHGRLKASAGVGIECV